MTDTDKPALDERYSSARNSKNLTVGHSDLPNRDADILAAAAWSQSRIGHALLQLHSEWDSAEKPQKPRKADAERIALSLPRVADRLDMAAGWDMANRWHAHEVGMLLGKLKTLPRVRLQLAEVVNKWGWEQPEHKSAEILRWWLDQTCHTCHGTKFQVIEGTNRQSSKPCHACQGSGTSHAPHGQMGKKLANWMDEGVNVARRRIRAALRNLKEMD